MFLMTSRAAAVVVQSSGRGESISWNRTDSIGRGIISVPEMPSRRCRRLVGIELWFPITLSQSHRRSSHFAELSRNVIRQNFRSIGG